MIEGLRVVFRPNPVSRALYSYAIPETGGRGTVTSVHVGSGRRTYLPGPGGGLVYVKWDDGNVCGVSPRDLGLEADK